MTQPLFHPFDARPTRAHTRARRYCLTTYTPHSVHTYILTLHTYPVYTLQKNFSILVLDFDFGITTGSNRQKLFRSDRSRTLHPQKRLPESGRNWRTTPLDHPDFYAPTPVGFKFWISRPLDCLNFRMWSSHAVHVKTVTFDWQVHQTTARFSNRLESERRSREK